MKVFIRATVCLRSRSSLSCADFPMARSALRTRSFSRFSARSFCSSAAGLFLSSLISVRFIAWLFLCDKFRLDRQFVARKTERLACRLLRYAVHFEEYAPGLYRDHVVIHGSRSEEHTSELQ